MATNRELQDELDELRLDLEQAEERERQRITELATLRLELSASEGRCASMQETIDALRIERSSLEASYEEQYQRLLTRTAQAARNMEEWEAELQGQLGEALRRASLAEDEAKRLNSWAQSQLEGSRQAGAEIDRLTRENSRLSELVERTEWHPPAEREYEGPGLIEKIIAAIVWHPLRATLLLMVGVMIFVIWLMSSIASSISPPGNMP